MSDNLVEIGDAAQEVVPGNFNVQSSAEEGRNSNPAMIENSTEEDEYFTIKRSHVYTAFLLLAFAVGLGSGYLLWGRGSSTSARLVSQRPNPPVNERFDVPIEDDPSIGPENAPIVIVEFSDFQCPYCRQFHQETLNPLLENYPDQILFVYRDFPILTQESINAAQAAECADEQGAFWQYANALFSLKYKLGSKAYETYANELGLNAQELMGCIESGRYADEVASDAQFASNLGVTGTPTFFINGIPLVGAQPLSKFKQVIDAELGN